MPIEITNTKSIIEQLLELSAEEIMDLLPNNILLGKEPKIEPLGNLDIVKYIDGTYCISYRGHNRNKKLSEQTVLFETCYCKSLKIGLIETYIKVQAITNKLFEN